MLSRVEFFENAKPKLIENDDVSVLYCIVSSLLAQKKIAGYGNYIFLLAESSKGIYKDSKNTWKVIVLFIKYHSIEIENE